MISHAICTHVPDMPGATHGIEGRGRRVIGFHTYVHRYTYTSYMLLNMDQSRGGQKGWGFIHIRYTYVIYSYMHLNMDQRWAEVLGLHTYTCIRRTCF